MHMPPAHSSTGQRDPATRDDAQYSDTLAELHTQLYWLKRAVACPLPESSTPPAGFPDDPPNNFSLYEPNELEPALLAYYRSALELPPTEVHDPVPYVNEAILVRDIIQLLFGHPTHLFGSPKAIGSEPSLRAPRLRLTHLTRSALSHHLAWFLRLATRLNTLRAWASDPAPADNGLDNFNPSEAVGPSDPTGAQHFKFPAARTIQAFRWALRSHLTAADRELRDLELAFFQTRTPADESVAPLTSVLKLRTVLHSLGLRVHYLHRLVHQILPLAGDPLPDIITRPFTTQLIDTLVRSTARLQLERPGPEWPLAMDLLCATLTPYLAILSDWLTTGTLRDPFDELAIHSSCPGQFNAGDHIPEFLRPHISTILDYGHEMNLQQRYLNPSRSEAAPAAYDLVAAVVPYLHGLVKKRYHAKFSVTQPTMPELDSTPAGVDLPLEGPADEAPPSSDMYHFQVRQPKRPGIDPVTTESGKPVDPPSPARPASAFTDFQPLQTLMGSCIAHFLTHLQHTEGPTLLSAFHRAVPWAATFEQLRCLYFILDGTSLDYFRRRFYGLTLQRRSTTSGCSGGLAGESGPPLLTELNSFMAESLLQASPLWRSAVSNVRITGSPAVVTASIFQLRPLNFSDMLNQLKIEFQKISRWVLQIDYARHLLVRPDYVKPPRIATLAPPTRERAVRAQRRRDLRRIHRYVTQFYGLRLRLLAFINGLRHYIMSAVLDTECARMEADLHRWISGPDYPLSFTAIVAKLTAFGDALTSKCFLDSKSSIVHKNLASLVQLVPQFHELYTGFIHLAATHPEVLTYDPAKVTSDPVTSAPVDEVLAARDRLLLRLGQLDTEFIRTRDFVVNILQISSRRPDLDSTQALALALAG
ncbi:hypothetical protein IWQ60_006496 [Tieghemiomyces parasiticus]|uniref:Spindle pole body component n=1 Tax=Tieghemiomyces parasiticus TaxID=78921 RepID=A0A9W8A809_9FUNG|nr:hypothetical protein IWQ60_006496 [Tieghemiomyces parasiticus]